MKTIQLNNKVEIPILGYGTYQISDKDAEQAVKNAIDAGYRHIDTAQSYLNEEGVGRGIKKSGIDREELFITTKIWVENVSYSGVYESFKRSLSRLQLEYIDLVLLHQPFGDVHGAYKALEELQKDGFIRAIGLSNFTVDRVVDISSFNEVIPQVNQIEINPFNQQKSAISKLKEENVVPEAWAPFAEGKNGIFTNEILVEIAKKYNKSVAQVIIRWLVEQDVVVLSKSSTIERIRENIDVFDFELTNEDKQAIETLESGDSQFFSHTDPEMVKWMASRKLNV